MDDLIASVEAALSVAKKDTVKNYYKGTLSTRLEPGGKKLLVSTRWAEDDICSEILTEDGWTVLDMPAINDKGKVLWPERWPMEELMKRKAAVGEYWFRCEYLNDPIPLEGNALNPGLMHPFKVVPHVREQTNRVMAVDLAISTASTADETSITVVDECMGDFYIQHQYSGRWKTDDALGKIISVFNHYRPDRFFIETIGFQLTYYETLQKLGYPVEKFEDRRKKEVKLMELAPILEQGRIKYIHDAPWIEELKHQIRAVPFGAHDDRVESLWMAINKANPRGGNPFTDGTMWRDKHNLGYIKIDDTPVPPGVRPQSWSQSSFNPSNRRKIQDPMEKMKRRY